MPDTTDAQPDPRVLCAVCPFPAATLEAVKLARRLARDVKTLSSLIVNQEQARKVQAIAQADADQAARLLEDIPLAEFFENEGNTP